MKTTETIEDRVRAKIAVCDKELAAFQQQAAQKETQIAELRLLLGQTSPTGLKSLDPVKIIVNTASLSLRDAVVRVVNMSSKPLSPVEIAQAIKKGGYRGAVNVNSLYFVLNQLMNERGIKRKSRAAYVSVLRDDAQAEFQERVQQEAKADIAAVGV